jgi:hypothetical protein
MDVTPLKNLPKNQYAIKRLYVHDNVYQVFFKYTNADAKNKALQGYMERHKYIRRE